MGNRYRYVRACLWSGPLIFLIQVIFWGVLGKNIPPFSSSADPAVIADYYRTFAVQIRAGMVVSLFGSPLFLMWGLGLTKVMEAVEQDNNILSKLQFWGAGLGMLVLMLSCWVWLIGAFRPEALNAATLQMIYDAGWLLFDCAFSVTSMQTIAFGLCYLSSARATLLVPRWMAWFSIWFGVMQTFEMLMPFFRRGAFGRDGFQNFYVEFTAFFIWAICATYYSLSAIKVLRTEGGNRP